MRSLTYVLIALAGVLALLVACPNPISLTLSRQATDRTPPVISLTSPEDGSSYESTVTLAGTVSDEGGQVSGLTLLVPVAELGISLELDDGNAFSYSFSTAGISRAVVITLQARDWNGNTTELVVTLFNDDAGPGIAILSPEDASTYLSTVSVAGRVQSMAELDMLTATVDATGIEDQALTPEEDGSFSLSFSTKDISSTILATFTATDLNGNASVVTLALYNDGIGPFVEITEPEETSYYSSVVRVSGTVLDAESLASIAEVKSVIYEVVGTSVSGTLDLEEDGSYSFEFQTKSSSGVQVIDGPRTIEVTATDWNLNATTADVTILRPDDGGDIPSFSVTPGSRSVTVEWDSVLYATSYTLHNPLWGEIRENVTSPYVWDDLMNGALYRFQLQAVIPESAGADAWSDLEDAIPLSERTLAPRVRETGYRSITIEWSTAPTPSGCTIERREGDGAWMVRTISTGTSFTDTSLRHDTWYSYRVTPMDQPDIASAPVPAWAYRIPDGGIGRVSTYNTSGKAYGVAVSGDYAYIADGEAGLQVIDISDPVRPSLVGTCDTTGSAEGVAVSGDYAYVADGEAGLQIIDISNPADPGLVGTCDTTGSACGVAVFGGYAYIADGTGLRVINIGSPVAPTQADSLDVGTSVNAVAVYDSPPYVYAYVVADYSPMGRGVKVINVTNPADISSAGGYNTPAGAAPQSIAISGSYAYVGGAYLTTLSLTNPTSPALTNEDATPLLAYGMAASDSYLYLANWTSGILVYSLADPAVPALAASYDCCESAQGVAISGGTIYVADYSSGMQLVDYAPPSSSPDTYNCDETGGSAYAVALAYPYAYVADGSVGLWIIDISDPELPESRGVCNTDGNAYGVAVSGGYAFVANGLGGLQVIDVSDPDNPTLAIDYPTAGTTCAIAIVGEYAYVADQDGGLLVFDVSDPESPTLAGSYDCTAMGVAISGSYAFVPDEAQGLLVLDISERASPSLLGSCPTTDAPQGIALSGSYAYIPEYSSGVEVVDVSDPTEPQVVGTYIDGGGSNAYRVATAGAYLFVADYEHGLRIVDVSDPTTPTIVTTVTTGTNSCDVVIAGPYAYVADMGSGLTVVDLVGE